MKPTFIKYLFIFSGTILLSFINPVLSYSQLASEDFVYGDALPDAPELAMRGEFKVSVRMIEVVHKDQIDILNAKDGLEPHCDWNLKLEVWYPALIPSCVSENVTYTETRGVRDDTKRPFLQFSFPERALRDATPERSGSPYPLLIVSHGYVGSRDLRIKAVVAFAPWEMKCGTWDSEGLKGLKIPTFFFTSSMDDISGYENGTKAVCNRAVNCERYLFTYVNIRHNVTPNPPPKESLEEGLPFDFYYHYAEPAWDQRRINNINQHFVTAFMGIHLKNLDYEKYFKAAEGKDIKT
jgi:hypothetical protein